MDRTQSEFVCQIGLVLCPFFLTVRNEINLMNKGIVLDGILSCIKKGIEERERNAIFALFEMEIGNFFSFLSYVPEKMIYV